MMWGASTVQGSSPLTSQRPGAKPQHTGPGLPEQEQPWKRVRDRASRGGPADIGNVQLTAAHRARLHRAEGTKE